MCYRGVATVKGKCESRDRPKSTPRPVTSCWTSSYDTQLMRPTGAPPSPELMYPTHNAALPCISPRMVGDLEVGQKRDFHCRCNRNPCKITATTHSDEPADVSGNDLGPNAQELLMASLGACANMTVQMYAERHHYPLKGVQAGVSYTRVLAENPLAPMRSSEWWTGLKWTSPSLHRRGAAPGAAEQTPGDNRELPSPSHAGSPGSDSD